ncbi:MAG: DEAD/DEAH box helicase family protein [Akkermansiaceae bacterium]|nr:DEAD/DEAH box helicase family protein [Akkermansiaceae bacterium]
MDILEKYRTHSFSERDKGNRFERLMKSYLMVEPKYKTIIETVWLWNEFPFRKDFGSGKDVGIDLVAKTFDGRYWAVQCKCYDKDTQITKANVDTFLATSDKRFQNEYLQATSFSHRLWISTNDNWTSEATLSLRNLNIPVSRINLYDLENSCIDWEKLEHGVHGSGVILKERTLRKHQQKAVELFHEHFLQSDRGRLIMACGTGKTFTALKIAEKETNNNGVVLFLIPSIALLGQTLNEWTTFAEKPIKPVCICSDAEITKKRRDTDDGGFTIEDLALPASTDVRNIVNQLLMARQNPNEGMIVVFSTYQSIDRVSEAQKALNAEIAEPCLFDLIICDEAHRTTGVALKSQKNDRGYDETAFIRIHDNGFIQGRKRVYMTATPRLYKDDVKEKAKEADAYLCSMDDTSIYGDEVFRIGFGEAVENDLLSDYKVLVLTVQESEVPKEFQEAIANSNGEITADDISKLMGCINALSKRMICDEELVKNSDPSLMHTAVAFCQSIKASKHITHIFNEHKSTYYETLPSAIRDIMVTVSSRHIDGTMGATERQSKLNWLKSTPISGQDCRILTNVRCLSEGVDVPSLDSVMFLSSRNSQVDVVQSVGRVMRKAPGKKYGYIIIPVIIPESMSPEEALDKSDCFGVVWTVLNALRAHDDRFNAEINKIDLNRKKSERILVSSIGSSPKPSHDDNGDRGAKGESDSGFSKSVQQELALKFESLQSVIFAKMVKKVGTRRYWELWAKDVASVAEQHIKRIHELIATDQEHKIAFGHFLTGLKRNLNPSVTSEEAVEMLAQHIITKPVFEALFENYSFVQHNPVSIAMQQMINLLHEEIPAREAEIMAQFYKSIVERCAGIDNAEGKQKVIVELYDKFFKSAFPQTVEKLGIVYTPVEVVDFIINSVAEVLEKEFDRHISDENVHILDPFSGTGTFITRLLQRGLIRSEDLERKYLHELHANEIVLLAYYIASINIENVYHDLHGQKQGYKAFDGICLTDTFQLGETEDSDKLFSEIFSQNSERVIAQKKAPIRIIIGNPPYSVGQKSANDNAQNQRYPKLESRIAETYAAGSKSTNKNSLYDSYIKAFRWASDRLDAQNGGIIAFVSNGAWIDGNATSGFRKCLQEEFSVIYVFHLRGNQRTSGELSRKEGGKIFGSGSRTPISITLLVKKPNKQAAGRARIFYHDIGDYLNREEKLKLVRDFGSILNPDMKLSSITPFEELGIKLEFDKVDV